MFQYRAVLVRLRQSDSDRDIARARLMGRPKVAALRALALREGWLALAPALSVTPRLSSACFPRRLSTNRKESIR
jgi:hypothetical protein